MKKAAIATITFITCIVFSTGCTTAGSRPGSFIANIKAFLSPSAVTAPSLTVTETEHVYKSRDARGVYSFGVYLGGVGQINLVNGNLVYGRQILSRPGRAGFNFDLSIYYNSKTWERGNGGTVIKNPAARQALAGILDSRV